MEGMIGLLNLALFAIAVFILWMLGLVGTGRRKWDASFDLSLAISEKSRRITEINKKYSSELYEARAIKDPDLYVETVLKVYGKKAAELDQIQAYFLNKENIKKYGPYLP